MRIGLYIRLFGRPGAASPAPTWTSIRDQALAAERAGFDIVVLEDGLLYPDESGDLGLWDTVSMAAAVAVSTTSIGIGHAVINSPYRYPALVAKTAETLDEISGGRYTLGIGLGNTPDDYPRFGIAADRRYSRFAESIRIIAGLLREGRSSFEGEFFRTERAELILRGPRPSGPPIVIAAGKPKAIRLAAEWGDAWNWWTTERDGREALRPLVGELEQACETVGRDPATLGRSLDVFSVSTPGSADASGSESWVTGSAEEIAEALLAYADLGFDEVRIDLRMPPERPRPEGIAGMADVVRIVQRG